MVPATARASRTDISELALDAAPTYPACATTSWPHLRDVGATLAELKAAVREALQIEEPLEVRIAGSDNQLVADATDLIEEAARRCGL